MQSRAPLMSFPVCFPARLATAVLALIAGLSLPAAASAQFTDDFEKISGSTTGVQLNGQGRYLNPVPASSVSFNCFLYPANALSIPINPTGNAYFVAGTGPGTVGTVLTYARSERKIGYCGDKFTAGFDVLALFTGTGTPADNIGSFSLQSSTTDRYFIALPRWTTAGQTWKMTTVHFDSAGTTTVYDDAITAFQGLALNKWYRWETDFDLKANTITEVRLTDLATKQTVKHQPTGWYLAGGSASTLPRPTAFRLFAGSSVAGNTLAFDNVSITLNETGQKAVANIYGSGTGRPNPAGSLVVTGVPVIDTAVSFGIHNPLATQASGTATSLWFSVTKTDPGLRLLGFGMQGGGAPGELLLGSLLAGVPGPAWTGSPSLITLRVPSDCKLIGVSAYAQGLMVDSTVNAKAPLALTEGVEIKVGNVK